MMEINAIDHKATGSACTVLPVKCVHTHGTQFSLLLFFFFFFLLWATCVNSSESRRVKDTKAGEMEEILFVFFQKFHTTF